jgi:hypothetical protein
MVSLREGTTRNSRSFTLFHANDISADEQPRTQYLARSLSLATDLYKRTIVCFFFYFFVAGYGAGSRVTTVPAEHLIYCCTIQYKTMLICAISTHVKLVFLGDFFSANKQKSECDWLVTSSVFVASQSSGFFCVRANKFAN